MISKIQFLPIGDFFKPCPSRAKAGFKNRQVGEKWVSDDCSYLCKGLK
ncbi:hypothetical protein BSPLISOX_3266 [uncultured Gammaproteobacteria bacterium]|nr:hypothetical protein BSPLISOX_3266 [uncultured Gammaproteobacteria bacterium]